MSIPFLLDIYHSQNGSLALQCPLRFFMKRMFSLFILVFASFGLMAQAQDTALSSQKWMDHFREDILPFWTTPEALGEPVGNFPTHRSRDGKLIWQTDRWPRMMGRQIFLYSAAFMMTGDIENLEYARQGVNWLIDKGWDKDHGGWYSRLTLEGDPADPQENKYTQDMSYAALGLASYFYVSRDPLAEEYLLKTYELIMGPLWDEENRRVWDGADYTLSREVDQAGGGWELVAILDQINAYMILVQPYLTQAAHREQWGKTLVTLGQSMIDHFLKDGYFWGQASAPPRGGRHVDFGHTLKAYWMLDRIDRRFGVPAFRQVIEEHVPHWINLAFDERTGLWGATMTSRNYARYGSSWWIYAESQQFAATLNLSQDGIYTDKLERTSQGWFDFFIDKEYGEVIQGIDPQGRSGEIPLYSNSKVWEWKNGFHSAEHALMMYIHGRALEGRPATLFFAARGNPKAMAVSPYHFQGRETGRRIKSVESLGGVDYTVIEVDFDQIR